MLNYLKSEKIEVVPKDKNPPNLPQCRPIEKFWALSKRAYKDRTRDKVDLAGIRRIWPIITTKVANQHGKSLFFEFPEKLLRVQREGVLSV